MPDTTYGGYTADRLRTLLRESCKSSNIHLGFCSAMQVALPALLAEVGQAKQLRSDLFEYGRHHGWCSFHEDLFTCSCGLDAAVARLRAALEKS